MPLAALMSRLRLRGADAIPVSMHCWQGDDVIGFDGADALSGGIHTTGNYPGRARSPEELRADIDKAISLIPRQNKAESARLLCRKEPQNGRSRRIYHRGVFQLAGLGKSRKDRPRF